MFERLLKNTPVNIRKYLKEEFGFELVDLSNFSNSQLQNFRNRLLRLQEEKLLEKKFNSYHKDDNLSQILLILECMKQTKIQESYNLKGVDMKKQKGSLLHIMESELDKAELVLAAKGISEELQSMLEKAMKLQVDELMPLVDRMKEIFGREQADRFNSIVQDSLDSVTEALKAAKEATENEANVLSGDAPQEYGNSEMDMDFDQGMGGMDMGMDDMGMDDMGMGGEDDLLGVTAPAAGGMEPLGRAKKESKERKLKVLETQIRKLEGRIKRLKTKVK